MTDVVTQEHGVRLVMYAAAPNSAVFLVNVILMPVRSHCVGGRVRLEFRMKKHCGL